MGPSWPCIDISDNRPQSTGEVRKSPVLSAEMELVLCRRWRDHQDISAVRELTGSYRRLVVMIAMAYCAHSVASEELIGEGCVGLMRAVCRFDPDRGVRFGTYAMWWVRATILEHILWDRSLAKKGTTASRKKLFFNLRRMHGHLRDFDDGTLKSESANSIVSLPQVPAYELVTMNPRMASADRSLNIPISVGSQSEWPSRLVNDEGDDQEATLAECEETTHPKSVLRSALIGFTTRERHGLVECRLGDSR
jgi:RNA polymerase sigma-32 factor